MKDILLNALAVGFGGFLGVLGRYGMSGLVLRFLPAGSFPWGTLAANLLGCLAIGVVMGLAEERDLLGVETRAFAVVGVIGGFTTFSTFGFETVAMMRQGAWLPALAYVGLHLVPGFLLVRVGQSIAA
ncbi:MAG: fluoride efflux transporter CrcB [Planctomycetota bacterium]